MNELELLRTLSERCDPDFRQELELLYVYAGEYVSAVATMEVTFANLAGRTGEEKRTACQDTDAARTRAHDRFIRQTRLINRLCQAEGLPALYTGSDERRALGDLAFALTRQLFADRR